MSKKRITWKIEKRKLADLKPHPKNPRQFTEKGMKDLENSINSIGFMQPININQDGTILSGHARVIKLKEMGEIEVDVYVPDRLLTPKQEEEVLVRANANTAGQWDFDILANEFEDFELVEWGLEIPELNIEPEHLEAKEDDFDGEPPAKPITILGDLYEIGKHRLLCGDSTCSDSVAKLMDGKKADMVFTDPPYLMDFTGGLHADGSKSFNSKHGGIKNDKMSKEDGDDFLDAINSNIQLFVKGAFYICFYRLKLGEYFQSLKRTGLEVRSLITWNKGNHTLSNSDYMSKCEHIFYGWVNEHNFYGGNNGMDIWEIPRTQKNELHPTMKPIPLCEKAINDASKLNDIVLDLFLGSGSTMVASHQLKRNCYGMELDPKYCDVIIKRLIKLDPSLKITRNGEDCKQEFIEKND
jgi:site-specific DNA-methyltransferase (adenine-specific)